jgi:hypothetical protein
MIPYRGSDSTGGDRRWLVKNAHLARGAPERRKMGHLANSSAGRLRGRFAGALGASVASLICTDFDQHLDSRVAREGPRRPRGDDDGGHRAAPGAPMAPVTPAGRPRPELPVMLCSRAVPATSNWTFVPPSYAVSARCGALRCDRSSPDASRRIRRRPCLRSVRAT